MFRFESLEIWKEAVAYGKECYQITYEFPKHENFSLSDQLRRAAVSISNNIAEGSHQTPAGFRRYLTIAISSLLETVNILNFAFEIGYIDQQTRDKLYTQAEILAKRSHYFSKSL